jgi:hypothetical protein
MVLKVRRIFLANKILRLDYDIKNPKIIKKIHKIIQWLVCLKIPLVRKIYNSNILNKELLKIISDKYKFIYIENYLAGSRTFLELFIHNPSNKIKAYSIKASLKKIYETNKKFKNYLVFSVVRNPWSRIVSCYNKKILNANNIGKITMISRHKGLYPQMNFKEFIAWLCSKNGEDKFADPHWKSQYLSLFNNNGKPKYHHLIKLENLIDEFKILCQKLNMPSIELPKKAKSSDQIYNPFFDNWKKYYKILNHDLIEKIEMRYKKDAEIFGYNKLTNIIY